MAKTGAKVIYGGAVIGTMTEEVARQQLDVLKMYKINTIDSANRYPGSESMLSKIGAAKDFTIHTKAPAFVPGAMTKQSVLDAMEQSLKTLGVDSVEVYYLHVPSPADPIEETLAAIRILYAAGKFKRFGLSNYLAAEVQKIYDIQKSHHSVLPSIYQANYNAFARKSEEDLFPLLRSLGFSIFAYSTTAGGFLAKDVAVFTDESRKAEGGRFAMDALKDMYHSLYGKPSLIRGLKAWNEVAKEEGITNSQLALRWVTYHSVLDGEKGDSVILGGKSVEQLEDCFHGLEKGPLSEGAVGEIEEIWDGIGEDAPRDNWNSYLEQKMA